MRIFRYILPPLLLACPLRSEAQDRIKMGVIVPLSGEYARLGIGAAKAAQLAAGTGEGRPVEIVTADNPTCGSQDAVTAFQRLAAVESVQAVLTLCTSAAKAIAPLAKARGLTLFQLTEPGGADDVYMIKMMPSSYAWLEMLGRFYALRYQRIAAVASTMEVNTGKYGNVPLFTNAFQAAGGRVVLSEEFPLTMTDFRALIAKLKSGDAQAVIPFIWDARQLSLFMKQADELALWKRMELAGNFTFEILYRDLLPLYPRLSELDGLVSVNFKNTTSRSFIDEYTAKFNEPPPQFSDYAYDSVKMVRRCGLERACLLQPHAGASGLNQFDASGRRLGSFSLKELRKGVFVEIPDPSTGTKTKGNQ